MTTLSNHPISLSKNKTRKNIKKIWDFYDQTKKSITNNPNETTTSCKNDENKQKACCLIPSNLNILDDNFITCLVCGTTNINLVDSSPEWRFYGTDDTKGSTDPSRCGIHNNPMLENNLSCSFQTGHPNQFNKHISTLIRYTNSSNFTYKDKTVLEDIKSIEKLGFRGKFTQCIIDNAIIIHKQITSYLNVSDIHYRSDNKDSILYGDFDLACKFMDVPRTAKEFSNVWDCDIQIITSGCKIVQTIYAQIEQNIHDSLKITSKHTNPSCFISRFCSNLQITDAQFTKMCAFIITKTKNINSLDPHNSQSIAAGVILFLATHSTLLHHNFNHKNISKAVGVSDVTISKVNVKLFEYHTNQHKLIPTKFIRAN